MTGKHPGLRSHTRKRKSGKVRTYYFLDRRTEGLPDVPLGTDYDAALKKYTEIRERAPRIAGTCRLAGRALQRQNIGRGSEDRKDLRAGQRRRAVDLAPGRVPAAARVP